MTREQEILLSFGDPYALAKYAVSKGFTWPEAEPIIVKNYYAIRKYREIARYMPPPPIASTRWAIDIPETREGYTIDSSSPNEKEAAILERGDPMELRLYCVWCARMPWRKAEPIIKTDSDQWKKYCQFFRMEL